MFTSEYVVKRSRVSRFSGPGVHEFHFRQIRVEILIRSQSENVREEVGHKTHSEKRSSLEI